MAAVVAAYLVVLWLNRFLASSAAKSPRALDAQCWTQVKGAVYYLWLFAMPVRLSVEHPFTVSVTLADLTVILSLLLLVSLGFWAWRAGRCLPGLGLAWFGLALLPASLVPLNILVSERRAYLAGAGLVLIAAWAWERLPRYGLLGRRPLGLVVAALCAVLCLQRNAVWASEVILWEDAARKAPGMHRARLNLAVAYDHAGQSAAALRELQAGLALQPEYADGWVIAGNLRLDQGDVAEAEQAYRRALGLNPSLAGVHHNLGNVLLGRRGDAAAAIPEYEACLRLDPFFVQARNNLGRAYEAVGRLAEAREEYRLAVADSLSWDDGVRDPERGGAWLNLGLLEQRLGSRPAATTAFSRALALLEPHPEYAVYAEQARAGLREAGP
jgi:tetratricopeptide (TPR) repeat protein